MRAHLTTVFLAVVIVVAALLLVRATGRWVMGCSENSVDGHVLIYVYGQPCTFGQALWGE